MTTIVCPSGLTGRIRGMKVREERILAGRKLAKTGGQVEQILRACWEQTADPGPYDFGEHIDWGKVLHGDRFFALIQIRTLSYGPEYAFAVGCENRNCRSRIEWELNRAAAHEYAQPAPRKHRRGRRQGQVSQLGVDWVLAPSDRFARYAFDVEVSRVLTPSERQKLRTIVDYLRPAHTHFVTLSEPAEVVTSQYWELGLSELGVTTELR